MAVANFVDLDELFDREHLARGLAQNLALGGGVRGLQQAVEGRGGFVAGAHEANHLELARTPFAVFKDLQPIDAEGEELGGAGGWGRRDWFGAAGRGFGGHHARHRMATAVGLAGELRGGRRRRGGGWLGDPALP